MSKISDLPKVGEIVNYEYCRGVEYSGKCIIRGYDGWEVWCKTIEGTNHFGTLNFVITVDCNFSKVDKKKEEVNYE